MSRPTFPLFQSHIDMAHAYWKSLILSGDTVIDATCGNGHDTLTLANLALSQEKGGKLIAIDTQQQAIESTRERLNVHLDPNFIPLIHLLHQCHSSFPAEIFPETVKLIVYNLGYLPGSDKSKTTSSNTTLQSILAALPLLTSGGALSITCYPGHPEGKIEEEIILGFAATLNPMQWSTCVHRWINRREAPSLLIIQKSK